MRRALVSVTAYAEMECAAGEECRLTAVVSSFEGIPLKSIGLCWPEWTDPG